jgi:phospholipid/cholesterol/gamma-HCH transport system permease protein
MKVQQEIDALETMGIPTYQYIVLPRMMAGGLSFFCMAVIFLITALFGSWIGANFNTTFPLEVLMDTFSAALTPTDIFFFFLKNTFIGSFIFRLACARGLSLKKAPFEVPIVTNKSVVDSLMAGIFLQISFSLIFYAIVGFRF